MTQYLLAVHDIEGQNPYANEEEMQQAFAATGKFNAKLQEQGVWVFGGGLQPADTATVVDARGGDVLVTDGPFAEAKEHLGGFWIITVPDLDAAMKLPARPRNLLDVRRGSEGVHLRIGGPRGRLFVRLLHQQGHAQDRGDSIGRDGTDPAPARAALLAVDRHRPLRQ